MRLAAARGGSSRQSWRERGMRGRPGPGNPPTKTILTRLLEGRRQISAENEIKKSWVTLARQMGGWCSQAVTPVTKSRQGAAGGEEDRAGHCCHSADSFLPTTVLNVIAAKQSRVLQ